MIILLVENVAEYEEANHGEEASDEVLKWPCTMFDTLTQTQKLVVEVLQMILMIFRMSWCSWSTWTASPGTWTWTLSSSTATSSSLELSTQHKQEEVCPPWSCDLNIPSALCQESDNQLDFSWRREGSQTRCDSSFESSAEAVCQSANKIVSSSNPRSSDYWPSSVLSWSSSCGSSTGWWRQRWSRQWSYDDSHEPLDNANHVKDRVKRVINFCPVTSDRMQLLEQELQS